MDQGQWIMVGLLVFLVVVLGMNCYFRCCSRHSEYWQDDRTGNVWLGFANPSRFCICFGCYKCLKVCYKGSVRKENNEV